METTLYKLDPRDGLFKKKKKKKKKVFRNKLCRWSRFTSNLSRHGDVIKCMTRLLSLKFICGLSGSFLETQISFLKIPNVFVRRRIRYLVFTLLRIVNCKCGGVTARLCYPYDFAMFSLFINTNF